MLPDKAAEEVIGQKTEDCKEKEQPVNRLEVLVDRVPFGKDCSDDKKEGDERKRPTYQKLQKGQKPIFHSDIVQHQRVSEKGYGVVVGVIVGAAVTEGW